MTRGHRATAGLTLCFVISSGSNAIAACNIVNGVAYGDCSGVTLNTQKTPFITVSGYESITGISEGAHVLDGGALLVSGIADRVIVAPCGTATISGMLGNLEVGGSARVSGQVSRVTLLNGGRVFIDGIVGALIGVGTAMLAAGSVVGGKPTAETFELTPNRSLK